MEVLVAVVVVATLNERSLDGVAEVAFSPRDAITPMATAKARTRMKSTTDTRPRRGAISEASGRTLRSSFDMVSLLVRAG